MPEDRVDLGEYFPGRVPALVADMWVAVLERAFDIEIINDEGRLFAQGSFALRHRDASVGTAEEAVESWRLHVEPELRAKQLAVLAALDCEDPTDALQTLTTSWLDFYDVYFLNSVSPWIDRARASAATDAHLAGRGSRVRRRQHALMQLVESEKGGSLDAACVSSYLAEFGAYSPNPELLQKPFPREEWHLVEAELAIVQRGTLSDSAVGAENLEESDDPDPLAQLLVIAEDDNHYKYEVCFTARRCLLGFGAYLYERGMVDRPEAIWNLTLESLRRAILGERQKRSEESSPAVTPISRFSSVHQLQGVAVVAGSGAGTAWRMESEAEPPDRLVLITEGLGSIHAGTLLPFAEGLLARYGTETSHCALIARELGRPVIVLGDDLDLIADGAQVTMEGSGLVQVIPVSEVSH